MQMYRRLNLRRKQIRQKLLLYGLFGLAGCLVFGFILSFAVFAWYARDLPSPGKLSQDSQNSTVFYDKDGKILYEMYKDKNRLPVAGADIGDYVKKATVAVEDKNFYSHKGISETGIIRAFLSTALGRGVQGGSTITQQLIKNVLLDASRTPSRKIKEAILAMETERRYTKDQILEMYLNEAPYGGSFYGIGTAARSYFGKEPKDLTLVESAILAGLPQNPTIYSPFIGKNNLWKGRAKEVLRRMREDGYITKTQEADAVKNVDKVVFTEPKTPIGAPHFVFYIKDQIEKEFGSKLIEQGVKIKTTLSVDAQKTAETVVKEEIGKLKDYSVGNGAAVVLDSQTGEVLAMVGSYDYNDDKYGKFNAALGLRQPGSAMKPITYTAAFEKGYTPATILMDVKTVFPQQGQEDYIPVNYDGKFRGPVQIRFALGNSLNVPAVKMVAMVGVRDFLQKASDMGLDTFAPTDENLRRFGLSITLGGGETTLLNLTQAFTVFANGGTRRDISAVTEISDYKGKILYKKTRPNEKKVLSPEISFLISHILSDNNARMDEFGPNSYLVIPGKTVAVKTGTTDDKRDNWAMGYTKSITVGVWVGNNDNSPMNQKIASGETGASPIWHRIMQELLKKNPDGIIDKPDKVKAVQIDPVLGGLPKDSSSTRTEYFIEGTEPKDTSPYYKKLRISKANGKIANDVEVRQGQYDEKDFIVFTENDPVSTDGKNRWQEAINAWAKDQSDSKYHYPTETSDASSDIVAASIKSPGDRETVTNNNVEIKAKIASLSPIKKVEIYVNGNKVKDIDGDNKEINETIHLDDGTYEIRVVARNEKDQSGDSVIKIGVNKPWDSSPTNTPTPAQP